MTDREKVIEWLKEISLRPCDFTTEDFDADQTEHLADDALDLLREQEAVKPNTSCDGLPDEGGTWWYVCGNCNKDIDPDDAYCRHCGKKVDWDA